MLPFSCIIKVYNAITTIFQSLVYQDHYAEKAERRMKTNIISSEELRQIGVSFDVKDNRLKDIGDYYIIDRTVEVGEETDRKEFRYGTIHLFLTDEKSSLRDPKRIAYSQSTDFYIMEDNTSEIYDDRSILILECRKEAFMLLNLSEKDPKFVIDIYNLFYRLFYLAFHETHSSDTNYHIASILARYLIILTLQKLNIDYKKRLEIAIKTDITNSYTSEADFVEIDKILSFIDRNNPATPYINADTYDDFRNTFRYKYSKLTFTDLNQLWED